MEKKNCGDDEIDKREAIKLVKQYADIVVKNMIVNKIILYGSYARGYYRKDSDINVAVCCA